MYIIKDWADNVCFHGAEFDSFEDAWSHVYETDPNTNEEDSYYDDYFVVLKGEV